MTRRVRVTTTGLKVADFSTICGWSERVVGKGLREEPFNVESLKSKEAEEDNAETQRAQRLRRDVWVAGTGWRLTNTTYVTICANTLSSIYWNAIRIACGKFWRSKSSATLRSDRIPKLTVAYTVPRQLDRRPAIYFSALWDGESSRHETER